MAAVSGKTSYGLGIGVALVATLLLVWSNLALGLIGSEREPSNLLVFLVPAVVVMGAILVRLQSLGMMRTMIAAAAVQTVIPFIALALGPKPMAPVDLGDISMVTAFFDALWLLAAALFRSAGCLT